MRFNNLLDFFNEHGNEPLAKHRLVIEGRRAHGHFAELELHSVFQPLYSRKTLQTVAYEALLRAYDRASRPVPTDRVFAQACSSTEVAYLDRLCRAIHAINFVGQSASLATLFLNVDGRFLRSVDVNDMGSTFMRLLEHCELRPQQIVLEIIESHIDDLKLLQDALSSYQKRGYRVAIDDFGCQHSNFDRLWQLAPDVVKLDRSLLVQAVANRRARKILPKLVEIIHDLGSEVVCEGIENADQLALAQDAGVDLLQGFYFSRPERDLPGATHALLAA